MSQTSFEVLKREPMCAYCGEMPASWAVITYAGGEEKRYPACQVCKEQVENGLHECDYLCEHDLLATLPADPGSQECLRTRLGDRLGDWWTAGKPPLRLENGQVVWDSKT